MWREWLGNFALQVVFFLGLVSVLGLFIWRLNKTLLRLLGPRVGRRVFLATGVAGTPIHEFGHVFFCVIFRHKIQQVKWFSPNAQDGTLGFVLHVYNRRNVYHQIGNFFIGIGPLLFGSAAIVGLMYLMLPNASSVSFGGGAAGAVSVVGYWESLSSVILAIFAPSNFAGVLWWVFILLAGSIALHMDLSVADIRASARGLAYITALLLVVNLVLCIIDVTWSQAVTAGCLWLSVSAISFMAIAVILLCAFVAVTALVRWILAKCGAFGKPSKTS